MKLFILGIVFSLLYVNIVLNNKANTPPNYIKPSIPGILDNGHIIICNYHIHHWIIFVILLSICCLLIAFHKYNDIYSFIIASSLVFIYHGLGYDDCFCFNS